MGGVMSNFDNEADWLWDYKNGFRIASQFGFGLEITPTPDKQDSNWYSGEVATVTNKELKHTISICAVGEIKIIYKADTSKDEYQTLYSLNDLPQEQFVNDASVQRALEIDGKLEFANNNWYECFDEIKQEFGNCVHHEIQEALDCAVSQLCQHRLIESVLDQADTTLWEE
jgi:hypothetical protein